MAELAPAPGQGGHMWSGLTGPVHLREGGERWDLADLDRFAAIAPRSVELRARRQDMIWIVSEQG